MDRLRQRKPVIPILYSDSLKDQYDSVNSFDKEWRTKPASQTEVVWTRNDFYALLAVTLVAMVIKLHNLEAPNSVVFDEVHFGGYATRYIEGRFFFDVHPPLGKLAFAAVMKLNNYNGSFGFSNIGDVFPTHVPYYELRLLSALFGAALVPLAFVTLKAMNHSIPAALFGAFLVLFDTAFLLQFRLILLDASLACFIAAAACFWIRFQSRQQTPFTWPWFLDLALTGVFLACSVGVKMVGLCVVAWVGFGTISDLWEMVCDRTVGLILFLKHFLARFVCLVAAPLLLYSFFFYIHFSILTHSGPGDGMMSKEFQLSLIGSKKDVDPVPSNDVGIGSDIKMKPMNSHCGTFHSHPEKYPEGSLRQQVTCSSIDDQNGWWILHPELIHETEMENFETIPNGAIIRLEHKKTGNFLVAENIAAPASPDMFEVSALDDMDWAGAKWEVRIKSQSKKVDKNVLYAHSTQFQLISREYGCGLMPSGNQLPQWGFNQYEMVCDPLFESKSTSLWRIEANVNDKLVDAPHATELEVNPTNALQPMPFWKKFFELHKVMLSASQGMTSPHPYCSRPQDWPLSQRGVNYWVKERKAVYFLGNPVTWWIAFASVPLFLCFLLVVLLRFKRGYLDRNIAWVKNFEQHGSLLFAAWAWHFIPFFFQKRQLFLHHYLPALYFTMLLAASAFDFALGKFSLRVRGVALVVFTFIFYWAYLQYLPFVEGLEMTKDHCLGLKWRNTWDFDCHGITTPAP